MLAGRIETADALTAVDGLSTGEELDFRRGTRECMGIAVRGRSSRDTQALGRALSAWAHSMPPGAVTTTSKGTRAVVTSCDPRNAATLPRQRPGIAIAFAATRNKVVNGILTDGGSVPEARCVGDRIVRTPIMTQYVTAIIDRDPAEANLVSALHSEALALDTACKATPKP
jgi:hypothetical protein